VSEVWMQQSVMYCALYGIVKRRAGGAIGLVRANCKHGVR